MLVAPIITQLSDLVGRRLTFLIPLYVAVLSNLICAVAPNYIIFLIFRFFAGVATTGFTVIGWVLCMESVALEFRSLIPLMGNVTWVLGYLSAGVLRLFITNWRWLYFAVSVPGLLTIPYYWMTPESLHWMITHKKKAGVTKYIRTSSRFNRTDIALQECKSTSDLASAESGKKRTVVDIFKNPHLLLNLILNAYILIVMNGTYWALSLFSTELSEDKMTGFFLSGIVELPAGLLAIALLVVPFKEKYYIGYASYDKVPMNIGMIFPLAAKCFNTIVWSSQPLLYTESTPTSVRNVFCGIVGFMGDFGSVVAPYLKRLVSKAQIDLLFF
uniref:MFS domain-containing protein n=1 Tax=Heterorhabditis bacteriophora TaxID=37862 RepID=A0A1I7X1U4_HETBA